MGADPIILPSNVMTEDRIRANWFGGPQVPFWNHDPTQLTIGLEVEYFIASDDGKIQKLANKQQYLAAVHELVLHAGYRDHNLPDQPGRVSKDTEAGYVAVKPDFAWHILEVSLPPRKNFAELQSLIEATFSEIDRALKAVGLSRLSISALPDAPKQIELVELNRLESFTHSMSKQAGNGPFSDPLFPAYIVATHVHLNAFNKDAIRLWPSLFGIESAVGEIYCRAKRFSGQDVRSVRTEFLSKTMGDGYKLKGIPEVIPRSESEYVKSMNESIHAFPKDRFFPVRDVSYVRPSRYGTIEFRSACSTKSVSDLVEIACWRIVQLVAAHLGKRHPASIRDAVEESLLLLASQEIITKDVFASISKKIRANLAAGTTAP